MINSNVILPPVLVSSGSATKTLPEFLIPTHATRPAHFSRTRGHRTPMTQVGVLKSCNVLHHLGTWTADTSSGVKLTQEGWPSGLEPNL
jgi:hypothetical protein